MEIIKGARDEQRQDGRDGLSGARTDCQAMESGGVCGSGRGRRRLAVVVRGGAMGGFFVQRAAMELYRGGESRCGGVSASAVVSGGRKSGLGRDGAGVGAGMHELAVCTQ